MSSSSSSSAEAFLVKQPDGSFKTWNQGQFSDVSSGASTAAVIPTSLQPVTTPIDEHFLPVPITGKPDQAAPFHFHPDDQQELQTELEKINSFLTSAAEKRQYSIEKIAAKIIDKHSLKLKGEQQAQFVSLLLSYFRQARSYVITRETLIQKLMLDPIVADSVMTVVKNLKDKIELADGVVVQGTQAADIESRSGAGQVNVPPAKPQLDQPMQVPTPAPSKAKTAVEPSIPSTSTVTVEPVKVRRPVLIEPIKIAAPVRTNRPARVMSRIDELAAITLEEWRQLDPDPRMRAAKILQRINNLAKESLARKAQGMSAWRSSQVYQTYLSMGHHGLEHGKALTQITEELKQNNQPYLDPTEFEAMTDLNKQLRF